MGSSTHLLAVGAHRAGRRPAERWELQLCGGRLTPRQAVALAAAVMTIVDVSGRVSSGRVCIRRILALLPAAAAAVNRSAPERLTQAEEQRWCGGRPAEEQQLAQQAQRIQRPAGDAGRHVHSHNIADVLGDHAEAVEDGQRHYGAVHLALQSKLLPAATARAT